MMMDNSALNKTHFLIRFIEYRRRRCGKTVVTGGVNLPHTRVILEEGTST